MCTINPIMYQNQIDKLPQIRQDYEGVKNGVNNIVDKDNKLPSIFDIIPTFRRVERVPDKVEHSDFVPATELVALAVLNAPEDNLNCYDDKYAKYTDGGNTGSIGIALACMFGYRNPKNMGQYPMTNIQFEACMKKVAELCRQYNIAITPDTVLTHYEFGLKHPETSSAGKPDIGFLPPYPEVKYSDVGYFIRKKVRWYLQQF